MLRILKELLMLALVIERQRDNMAKGIMFTPIAFGFQCDDGWANLLVELCEKIQRHLDTLNAEQAQAVFATQVKEKYGTLRFYLSCHDDVLQELISNAERQSANTCEVAEMYMTTKVDSKWTVNSEFDESEVKIRNIDSSSKEYLRIIPKGNTLDVVVANDLTLTDAAKEFIIAVTKMLPIEINSNNTPAGYSIILFCAFRYALGRSTYVVGYVVQAIHAFWPHMSESDKSLYVQEILEYEQTYGRIGMDMDKKEWYTIVDRYNSDRA